MTGGVPLDSIIEARVDSVMALMSVADKVAQTIQGDINSLTVEDVREYRLGSVLNGGNSAPGANNKAPAPEWLALADQFYDASMDVSGGRLAIPILWGTDAVHGHNNVVGATVFPHNIGLGAMRNPELAGRIGAVTALETEVTGQNWTFAPTLAVVQDDRWGRAFEGYSEHPEVVASYARPMVEGIQGVVGTDGFLGAGKVISSAKHFLGDGGTVNGKDQGDNVSSEADMRDIHAAGYIEAVPAGVQTIMASYNSWYGKKMHGNKSLLQDVLKDRMGFNGFVVGDWNGHGQVAGCEPTDCPASFNAGLDMFMAPDSWRDLYTNMLASVESGEISMERLDDAVRRILRVKFLAGLFSGQRPSDHANAGKFELLGAPAHRAIARQAARESLVLLKNTGVLPIAANANVLVAGDGADNIGKQTGGWTLTWQGDTNDRSDFPNGESIWEGLQAAVRNGGGTAVLSVDGSWQRKPDVAIVVFGENPYAEFMGDTHNLDFNVDDSDGLALLTRFREQGIPTVSVFLSGRPMWVNPEINASDAFVAAWLPGTEGGGIADVLIGKTDGTVNFDFKGKLSYSWPKTAVQSPLNWRDEGYDPLFAYGFGLGYQDDGAVAELSEESGVTTLADGDGVLFGGGEFADALTLNVNGDVNVRAVDRAAQEDSRMMEWGEGDGMISIAGDAADFTRESNGDMAIALEYRVDRAPVGRVELFAGCGDGCEGAVNIAPYLSDDVIGEWQRLDVKLSCLAGAGADMSKVTELFGLRASDPVSITISSVRLESNTGDAVCPGN